MNSYLRLPFIYLALIFLPAFAFSQTQVEEKRNDSPQIHDEQTHPASVHSQEEILQKYLDENKQPEIWRDHAVEKESDTFQSKFFHMLFILGLLIAFMMIASWSLKRMMRSKATNMNSISNIKVLETRYLSPRATLYLVEINDKQVLIAESPAHVTYLATLSESEK